ncbi:MAG: PhnD/SsuA/transferrin family substrate-binding protein [Pseudomonadota bacterium]
MYARPETWPAYERLWASVRDQLQAVQDVPRTLNGSDDLWRDWKDPGLLLSQTCSLPFRTALSDKLTLLGSPQYDLDSPPGYYHSVIVVRSDDRRENLADFSEATFAVNDALSQSGWAAIDEAARLAGFSVARTILTGSHFKSACAVAASEADIASLDALTWKLMNRWDRVVRDLRVLDRTAPTPGLPFVTARPSLARMLVIALQAGFRHLSKDDRFTLGQMDLVQIPVERYLELPAPRALPT